MNQLLYIGFRQNAVFIPAKAIQKKPGMLAAATATLVGNLAGYGFGVSDTLLQILNGVNAAMQEEILEAAKAVMGANRGWTPLETPYDEALEEEIDFIIAFYARHFSKKSTRLSCGHFIPDNTFPLEMYNCCPLCGTGFEWEDIEYKTKGTQLKVLQLWTEKEAIAFMTDLLLSKTALDATQMDSLKMLLAELPMPDVAIGMKETLMTVIDIYRAQGRAEKAQALFTSPADILRYLWYKHTGFLQVIAPAVLIKRTTRNSGHISRKQDMSAQAELLTRITLQLKYTRKEALMVANWLNHLPQDADSICEQMHTKRGMWVRMIRALRLAEYSKREGMDKLREVLDKFYNQEYPVLQGWIQQYRLKYDAAGALSLLKVRPGLFARSLFANMVWFGYQDVIAAFDEVTDRLPARLLITLASYAESYFDRSATRLVRPLGGIAKSIPANKLLAIYNDAQLEEMKTAVKDMCFRAMQNRFAAQAATTHRTIYIAPELFAIPVAIGDRGTTIQDVAATIAGTRFAVNGDVVRLFMQWGTGLPAQRLDMDLSCMVYYPGVTDRCSFSALTIPGCKHSGDVIMIPEKTGAAEYIELDLPVLRKKGAQYVAFTCNAYSAGAIAPELVVGWMNGLYRMAVSKKGVFYDPAHVQHQARVMTSLDKGLLFGVLDVAANEIIWLEMPFEGQVVQHLYTGNVQAIIEKLSNKITIGQLLTLKAAAQQLQIIDSEYADESYTRQWAMNTAAVTQLLIDA